MKIHKEVYGQGKPIVLLHGWAMHTGVWRRFAKQLAKQYKVICLDLPGHGLSETTEPYALDYLGASLIDAVQESKFCVLGWSLGASVALTMAKNYPHRIDSLIILAGNPRFIKERDWAGMRPELLESFAKNLKLNSQLTLVRFLALQVFGLPDAKSVLNELKKAIHECEPPNENVLQSALNILKNADLRNDLSQLCCPVNIIQGDEDTLIPVQASLDMQKLQPTCELNIITGAGHLPFLSHQTQVIEAINYFL